MITYRNIHIQYDRELLKDEKIMLEPGCLTLLHGPSGIGKSALLYRIGLLVQDCGMESDDIDLSNIERTRREDVAFVMQGNDIALYMTVAEICREYARIGGFRARKEDIGKALAAVHLDVPLDQTAGTLSLGERQRLCIACALMKQPRLIVLDEPTASLDNENKEIVFGLLREIADEGRYVVFSSHEEMAKDYADAIYVIKNQRLVEEKKGIAKDSKEEKARRRFDVLRFIANHIRSFAKKNKMQIVSCNMFSIMAMLAIASMMFISETMVQETISELYEMSDKYLYVTNAANQGYLDKDSVPVELEDGYPVHRMQLMDVELPVVPYFDEMDFSDKMERRGAMSANGIYVSLQASKECKGILSFYNGMSLNVITVLGPVQWSGPYNGILKQGVKAYACSTPDEYVAMYYRDMEELSQSPPIGRIIFYDTLEEALKAKKTYQQQGFKVNDEAIKRENIENAARVQHSSLMNAIRIVAMISFLLLLSANLANIRKRNKEFALLRSNGIHGFSCATLLAMENMFSMAGGFVVSLVASLSLWLWGNGEMAAIPWVSLAVIVMMHMAVLLMDAILLQKMDIEKIFRN